MTTQVSFPTRAELIAIVLVILQLDLQIRSVSAEPLNSFVSHFEPLNYNRDDLEETHQRVRRSLDEDNTLHLDFNAHGRKFKLRLKRDTTIFAPDFEDDGDFDPSKVYTGHVEGHSGSSVHGFVHNRIFEGNINLSDKLKDGYHVEPSSDHFDTPKDFHSVIYKASDLHYPYSYGQDLDLSDKTKKWMEEARKLSDEHFSTLEKAPASHRYKRASGDEKLICQIHLRADHLFTEKRADKDKERAKLLMTKHVQAVHNIYKDTAFKINGKFQRGIGFAIKKMRANNTDDTTKGNNPYAQEYIGVERFLDIISLEETSTDENKRYCLSHVFTYRDFEDGVLGLAWVGEAAGKAAGGVCEIARRYSDGRKKTLNTGVVTFVNYNKAVPSRVSEVTFAHELGHNFGAKHDPSECSGQDGGNYIMFPKATSGTDTNNRKFSTCSVGYISPVIETKGQGSEGCFKATNASICGNQVVEEGEECDCGFEEDCTSNERDCCYSATEAKGCKLKAGKTCSPSQGLCCNEDCTFSSTSKSCDKGQCIDVTNCSGSSPSCPLPALKKNLTDCNENRSVCIEGECSGSRCLKFNKMECQCVNSEDQCVLCCKSDIKEDCIRHNESGTPVIKLLPGAPCDNYQGYCDVLEKCRGVDSEGPLERIKNLLFGADAINNLVDWVKTYWWAAILIGIGLILLMAGFIKLCSVATPSSNPSKPKAKTMSLRRHPRANPGFLTEQPPDIEMGNRPGRQGKH